MRIAALSDFHIGAWDHTDGFRHDPVEFAQRLQAIEAAHDRIVLLGDIYQTDHATVPRDRAARRHLSAALRRVPALAQRFAGSQYVYVHGNHDEVAARVMGAAEGARLGSEAPTYFTHGHQFDPVLCRAFLAARAGTWATGQLRRVGLRPVAKWFETRDVEIKHERFRGRGGPYARGADTLMRQHAVRCVVMGHTHVSGITKTARGVMVNTGTCSDGAFEYASIDTTAAIVQLRDATGVRDEAGF